MEPKGCIKPCPPTLPTALKDPQTTSSQEPQTRTRIEWSRLLTKTGNTAAAAAALSDAGLASRDREDATNGRGEVEGRMKFDLGFEGEAGRKAWYVPTERTVFPVKKGVGRESHREKRTEVVVVEDRAEDDVLWGITERKVECAMRREEVGGERPRLRTRRSLEEDILGIEDEESRRLTAIAYLS